MTTSGSYNWEENCAQIIARALRQVRVVSQGDAPSAEQIQETREALNAVIHRLQKKGNRLWAVTDATITTVIGQQAYNLDPSVIEVAYLKYRDGTGVAASDRFIKLCGSLQWQGIIQQAEQNERPLLAYLDQQTSPFQLKLWPVPASIRTIYFRQTRKLYDMDATNNSLDFPQHWIDALTWALAATISQEYGLPVDETRDLRAEARRLIKEAQEDDREPTDDGFVEGAF